MEPQVDSVMSQAPVPLSEIDQIEARIMVKSKEIRDFLRENLRIEKFPPSPRGQKFMMECELKGISPVKKRYYDLSVL